MGLLISVLDVTSRDIRAAMQLEWKDFEDCLQYIVAKNNNLDCIITNNTTDFKNAALQILSPQEYTQNYTA